MYLQLAENNLSAKVLNVRGYKRKPTVKAHTRKFPKHLNDAMPANPYVFIPDFEAGHGGVNVREDKFDMMPDEQYNLFMRMVAPYQPDVQAMQLDENEFLADRASRRAAREARRAERQKRRSDRSESKNASREERAEAKRIKAEGKGESGGGFFDKVKDAVSGFINKDGGEAAPDATAGAKPFYKNPIFLVVAGGILIGGIYYATKKPAQV